VSVSQRVQFLLWFASEKEGAAALHRFAKLNASRKIAPILP
jgi:hypothetical protein